MAGEVEILAILYKSLIADMRPDGIPVDMRPADIVGTVQDDPFDCWVEAKLKSVLPSGFEIYHAGKLTTPDLIIRDKSSGFIIGLEIKKLIQRADGKDSRGLTIDYNSCRWLGSVGIR